MLYSETRYVFALRRDRDRFRSRCSVTRPIGHKLELQKDWSLKTPKIMASMHSSTVRDYLCICNCKIKNEVVPFSDVTT